jgi:hypothetical protein
MKLAMLLTLLPMAVSAASEVVVVRTFPANNAADVDPNLTYIRIRFSEAARTDSYSVVNVEGGTPVTVIGTPSFAEGNTLCVLQVKLQPGTSYALGINSQRYHGFCGAQSGVPVTPYVLKFTTSAPARNTALSADKWREDIAYLGTELPKRHKNLFSKMTREQWDSSIKTLQDQVPGLSEPEILVGLKKLFALIGDQHSDISVFENGRLKRFPIAMYWFKDGVYVVGAADPVLLGCRITKIGDMDIDRACDAVSTLFPHDNDSVIKKNAAPYLAFPDILHSLKLTAERDSAAFTVVDADGKTTSVIARPVASLSEAKMSFIRSGAPASAPLYMKNMSKAYWVERLDSEGVIYFQYNKCADTPDYPLATFTSDLNKLLAEHADDRLVIDLRNNGGGNSSLLDPLIDDLKSNSNFNRKGKLFVIVGRQTFSSAVMNSARLRYETKAIFFGETAGGAANHFGEVREFALPNSGLSVYYSTKYFQCAPDGASSAIAPDVAITPTFAEFKAGKDPVLDGIISYRTE